MNKACSRKSKTLTSTAQDEILKMVGAPMRILAVDVEIVHEAVTGDYLEGSRAFLDFDILVLDIAPFLRRMRNSSQHLKGYRGFSAREANTIGETLGRRSRELMDFIDHGRTAIVLPCPDKRMLYDKGNYLEEMQDIGTMFPGCGAIVQKSTGEHVEVKAPEPYATFLNSLSGRYAYDSVYTKTPISPVAFIKGTTRVVSELIQKGDGWVLVMPRLVHEKINGVLSYPREFIESLIDLVRASQNKVEHEAPPVWATSYFLPTESQQISNLAQLREEKYQIELKIKSADKDLQGLQEYKRLFTATGKSLESIVAKALFDLGFEVEVGHQGRDDLIIKDGVQIAVVEVKGKDKSAAERDAAQLEKWVAEYCVATGTVPKGILIVNAYKNKPLESRDMPAFPDQMLIFSQNRKHCLISGLQLACLALNCKTDEAKKQARAGIFAAEGVFPNFLGFQWSEVIEKISQEVPDRTLPDSV